MTVLLVMVMVFPAFAAMQDFHATVHRWSGNYDSDGSPGLTKATTGITYKVLATRSNTAETLYAYGSRNLTAKTNPVTATVFATDKEVSFRCDPTDATSDRYVDLIVTDTVGGYSQVVKNFDRYTHTIVIDERPNIKHHGLIWFSGTTTAATNTGIIFGAYTNIEKVGLEVVTASAQTISVGTGTTPTGYINLNTIASTGFVAIPGETTGSLLGTGTAYQWYQQGSTITSSTSLTYTLSSGIGAQTGYIHYYFTRVR